MYKGTMDYQGKVRIAEKDEAISDSDAKIESLSSKRSEFIDSLNTLTVERDTLTQKADMLQRMTDRFEGYAESIKFVMREYNAGNIRGNGKIHGPLLSLISVEKK